METRDCIKNRRSIRKFTDQPISDELIIELMEAVRWSPSWANTQTWKVIIVKDQVTKDKLIECIPETNPAYKGILQAPVVIVLCAKQGVAGFKNGERQTVKGDWYMFDAGIACQNLCLAAHDLGLGTVIVGGINHKKLDELLGLPEDVKTVVVLPIGYPAKEGKAPARKELKNFVYIDHYGKALDI